MFNQKSNPSSIPPTHKFWKELLNFNQVSQQEQTIACLNGRFFLVSDLAHVALDKLLENQTKVEYQETLGVLSCILSKEEATELTEQLFVILTPTVQEAPRKRWWDALKKGLIRIPVWIPSQHLTEVMIGKVLRPLTIWAWVTLCLVSGLIAIINGLVAPTDPLHLTTIQFATL